MQSSAAWGSQVNTLTLGAARGPPPLCSSVWPCSLLGQCCVLAGMEPSRGISESHHKTCQGKPVSFETTMSNPSPPTQAKPC